HDHPRRRERGDVERRRCKQRDDPRPRERLDDVPDVRVRRQGRQEEDERAGDGRDADRDQREALPVHPPDVRGNDQSPSIRAGPVMLSCRWSTAGKTATASTSPAASEPATSPNRGPRPGRRSHATTGTSRTPTNACTDRNRRKSSSVAPSAATRTRKRDATAAASRELRSDP